MRIEAACPSLVLLCIVTPAIRGLAQSPDSLAFRPGQWGAEFHVESGFAGAGALHFTSPTWAWLLDLGARYTRSAAASSGLAASNDALSLSLRIGRRRYAAITHHVAPWTAFGITALYGWQRSTRDTLTARGHSIGGGLFGTLGATWFVTPHLGLGAQWGVTALYIYQRDSDSFGDSSYNALSVSLPNMALVGQIYF